ncbi:MAG: hypothetical protein COT18_13015 [Elusimicrobia bacterium CG08_land_8_20_14_0_20_59_10]|nr:MAG: hypothetical protein COT18_13015 [Elusimicrobia bacterium CG08_land_8_20_14_0_20_59_10]
MKIEIRKPTENEKKAASSWPIWTKEVSSFPWRYVDSRLQIAGMTEGYTGSLNIYVFTAARSGGMNSGIAGNTGNVWNYTPAGRREIPRIIYKDACRAPVSLSTATYKGNCP